jgi:DNA glycosylase AlkZ-like
MLGYRTREPVVAAGDDRRILPGGGMLRPAVLIDGLAAGTWSLTGQGGQRTVTIQWFRRPAASAELRAEQLSVERFLGLHEHVHGGVRAAASAASSTRRSRRSP